MHAKAKVLDIGAEFNEPALCVCLSVCVRDSCSETLGGKWTLVYPVVK